MKSKSAQSLLDIMFWDEIKSDSTKQDRLKNGVQWFFYD